MRLSRARARRTPSESPAAGALLIISRQWDHFPSRAGNLMGVTLWRDAEGTNITVILHSEIFGELAAGALCRRNPGRGGERAPHGADASARTLDGPVHSAGGRSCHT